MVGVGGEEVEEEKLASLDMEGRLIHHLQRIPKVEIIVDGKDFGGGESIGGYE